MVIFNSYVSLPEGISMLLWDPLGCTTVWFIKYMQDISICTSETKVVWNAEMHGYYAKTIGWQVGQQPPKIKQTKMNQVVFYTSFDLLGMHKYLCSCSQQQATLFLNWVLPTLWEFKGKSSSGFLHQPISLPIFLTWMQLTPVLGVEWVEALDMGEVLRRSSLHRLFWALGAPSMIPPVAVKMSHFGCWWLRNWNTNNITDMKTSVSCGHNQWPHATPPNRAWCSWGETGAAQWTPTTTQHQTIKPSNHQTTTTLRLKTKSPTGFVEPPDPASQHLVSTIFGNFVHHVWVLNLDHVLLHRHVTPEIGTRFPTAGILDSIDLICSWNSVHTKVRSYCWFLTSHD